MEYDDIKSIKLNWNSLTFSIEQAKSKGKYWNFLEKFWGKEKETLKILNNVSGEINSGELVAVIGSSGSGKTTLLAAISQRLRGNITGNIQINGNKISQNEITKLSTFVPQHDIVFDYLTVAEHMHFMSELKMDSLKTKFLKNFRVNEILKELNLEKCKHTKISSLSGGEKKKLSLACELLNEPLILFCDEPTSGLDSFNALSVINTLKRLSSSKAIMCSIHHPTSDIFQCFTHLILMNSGKIIFQGSVENAKIFFKKLNLICPNNYNPAEFYLNQISSHNDQSKIEKIYQNFLKNYEKKSSAITDQNIISFTNYSIKKVNWIKQVYILLSRSQIELRRSVCDKIISTMIFLITAITIGLLYSSVTGRDQISVKDIQGSLLIISTEIIFTCSYDVLYAYPTLLPQIRRETGEELYSISAFYIANFISNIPIIVIKCFLFMLIVSISLLYLQDIFLYLLTSLILSMCAITANAYGFMLSGMFDDINLSIEIAAPIDLGLLILGGFYVNLNSFPIIKYLSLFYFGNEALSITLWENVTKLDCTSNLEYPCMRNGTEVLHEYGYSSNRNAIYFDILGLAILCIVMHMIAFLRISKLVKRSGYY